jgi:galactose mutarotase-like enzyme
MTGAVQLADIRATTWHHFAALTLESELMRVVIAPELGAKIVSIFDKTCHHEWLVPPMRPLGQATYGADFVSQDMSGWDEMMPTIIACAYEGVQLPDHGEVWSIPWDIEKSDDEVVLSTSGKALPYRLTRSASLVANRLKLSYSLENTGQRPFPYLWAAHPQFAADLQTRIILPPEAIQVVNVVENDPVWGKSGGMVDWPHASSLDGRAWQLDRVRSAQNQACRKFYLPPEQRISWAALLHEGLGCQLRMEWQPSDLPYLGIWVDEGKCNIHPVVALEPSNGYYDSLTRAIDNRSVDILAPGSDKKWEILVETK